MEVDIYSRVPIYQQIIDEYKREIILGVLKEGEQIRSVRELSQELQTNPNTIQKAYTELERQKLIFSAPGKGSFVSSNAQSILKQATLIEEKEKLMNAVERLVHSNVPMEDVLEWVASAYQINKGEFRND